MPALTKFLTDVPVNKVATGFLCLQAALFIACGVIGLLNPVGLLSSMGLAFESAVAITEIRATYGGFLLGGGFFILYTAFNDTRVGLISVVFLLAGAGLTRAVGMVVDGGQSTVQWLLLLVELLSVVIALYLHRFTPSVR